MGAMGLVRSFVHSPVGPMEQAYLPLSSPNAMEDNLINSELFSLKKKF
jgi:hypothetical protein